MQKRNLNKLKEISFPLASILVALILGAIIMSAMGYDVGKAYSSLLKGAFGSKNSIAETLIQTTPLIFTALSYAIALRCGLVNLGAEGQLYMGAICGSMVGAHIQGLPPVLHIILVLLCGFIGGALWGPVSYTHLWSRPRRRFPGSGRPHNRFHGSRRTGVR